MTEPEPNTWLTPKSMLYAPNILVLTQNILVSFQLFVEKQKQNQRKDVSIRNLKKKKKASYSYLSATSNHIRMMFPAHGRPSYHCLQMSALKCPLHEQHWKSSCSVRSKAGKRWLEANGPSVCRTHSWPSVLMATHQDTFVNCPDPVRKG